MANSKICITIAIAIGRWFTQSASIRVLCTQNYTKTHRLTMELCSDLRQFSVAQWKYWPTSIVILFNPTLLARKFRALDANSCKHLEFWHAKRSQMSNIISRSIRQSLLNLKISSLMSFFDMYNYFATFLFFIQTIVVAWNLSSKIIN